MDALFYGGGTEREREDGEVGIRFITDYHGGGSDLGLERWLRQDE
jgi:hypothetical protein